MIRIDNITLFRNEELGKNAQLAPAQKETIRLREEDKRLRFLLRQVEEERKRRMDEVVDEGIDDIKKLMAGKMDECSADVLRLLMSKDTGSEN